MKLSIVIPAYNEEKRILKTLQDYYNFFNKKLGKDFEIFVVVNGCTDNTLDVVKKFKKVRYEDIGKVKGKGAAVIYGFKKVNSDFIGFVDADGSTSPSAFYDLFLKINGYDGIVASRWIKGAMVSPKQPFIRRFASRVFNIFVKLLFRIPIRDTQCGAKLFTKKAVKDVVDKIGITQWAFDIDLLYQLKRLGYKTIEIPTTWSDDPNSRLNVKKASMEMFLAVTRLRLVYSPFKFVVRIYDWIMVLVFGK